MLINGFFYPEWTEVIGGIPQQWRIQGGGGRPLLAHTFFQKGAFFRVKGIQSVVCICDK